MPSCYPYEVRARGSERSRRMRLGPARVPCMRRLPSFLWIPFSEDLGKPSRPAKPRQGTGKAHGIK